MTIAEPGGVYLAGADAGRRLTRRGAPKKSQDWSGGTQGRETHDHGSSVARIAFSGARRGESGSGSS
jgi:hypothetical protein